MINNGYDKCFYFIKPNHLDLVFSFLFPELDMSRRTLMRRSYNFYWSVNFAVSNIMPLTSGFPRWTNSWDMQETTSSHCVIEGQESSLFLGSLPCNCNIDISNVIGRNLNFSLQDEVNLEKVTTINKWHYYSLS